MRAEKNNKFIEVTNELYNLITNSERVSTSIAFLLLMFRFQRKSLALVEYWNKEEKEKRKKTVTLSNSKVKTQ